MSASLRDLPPQVAELLRRHRTSSPEVLDAISEAIAARRDEAKAARKSSGIETIWAECEDAYAGIDDANRGEFSGAIWSKSLTLDAPATTTRRDREETKNSTVFVKITAPYVDAGASKLAEIILPVDDKAFSFSETPVPDLIAAQDNEDQVFHEGLGVPLTRAHGPADPPVPTPGSNPPPGGAPPPAGVPGAQVPLRVKDLAAENIAMARKKAKAAETRIYDWMVECQYPAQMRKVLFDAARIGVGVLKGPVPRPKRVMTARREGGKGVGITIKDVITPVMTWVDPWNIYPDPSCGENIKDGDYVFECDQMTSRKVRELKRTPGYNKAQIDKVLQEGPDKSFDHARDNGTDTNSLKHQKYTVWYYYGVIKSDEMAAINSVSGYDSRSVSADDDSEDVYAIVTLINDSAVRASINPLDSGSFPYHAFPWQRRGQIWAGIGVAEQIRTPQRILNAATRAMMNNAGKSAGSQFVIDKEGITPADDKWTITPDKIWHKTADAAGMDVRQLFMAIQIPNTTPELMTIINYAMRLAEESTSIPLVTQGQSGPTTPNTLGAVNLQNTNANLQLRAIGYAVDDYITEPVVQLYYEWLLLDPDVPDDEKGDFSIDAHGSVALVERNIQDQTIAQIIPMAANPSYGIDPKKVFELFLRSKRLDPADVQYTKEEQAKIAQAPPPEDPAVQVAKIAAASRAQELAASTQLHQQDAATDAKYKQAEAAADTAKVHVDMQHAMTQTTVQLHEIETRRQLAMLDYATQRGISLEEVKADLAKAAMTINAQEKLNDANNAARHALKPPVQAPGRAADGHAFDQSEGGA